MTKDNNKQKRNRLLTKQQRNKTNIKIITDKRQNSDKQKAIRSTQQLHNNKIRTITKQPQKQRAITNNNKTRHNN